MAAEALMAFRRGDTTDEARVGAILIAEGLDHLGVVADFCVGLSKGLAKRGR